MTISNTILRSAVVAAALTVAGGSAAWALPAQGTYDASTAVGDATYYGGSSSHAIYLPISGIQNLVGNNANWIFTPDDGELTVTNGASATMHLQGVIHALGDAASSFLVQMDFQLYSEFPSSTFVGGTPTPKKELNSSAYTPGPGGIDTNTWDYYLMTSGSLTGLTGAVAGLDLSLAQAPNSSGGDPYGPYLTQIGDGANGKNLTYGLSTWFTIDGYGGHGDVNINLVFGGDNTSVPEPTTAALLGLGLVGIGVASRRRKRA